MVDKYEYKLKFEQMKALAAEGDYAAAEEIADTIHWRKVKNINLLIKAGDIYTKRKRYEEAYEILHMAYDRSPIGRTILYRLAELSIKMKNFEEAEEYYDEFVEIAPHDNLKYVLRYKISKAKNSDIKTRITILEELKEAEYTEEWAYELAFLYHKAGESEKCIDACDELILWFGDGIYVERAMELKMFYQPLTKPQEDKYRRFKQRRDGVKEVHPQEEGSVQIPIVRENVEKFNTANLQEELAKSMRQIMNATKKETVDDTMDNIKKMVEDFPYLKMHVGTKQAKAKTDQEIDDSLRSNYNEYKEILAEDYDGQMSMLVKGNAKEPQISGQMGIGDVLSDWEKTRRAAQTALQMAQQQKLESAKARALQEAGDIMDRLADVIPKLDAGISPTELLREEYLSEEGLSTEEKAGRFMADMNDMLQQQIDKLQEETKNWAKPDTVPWQNPAAEAEHELIRRIKQSKPAYETVNRQTAYNYRQPEQQVEEDAGEALLEENEDPTLLEEMRIAEAEFYGIPVEELEQQEQQKETPIEGSSMENEPAKDKLAEDEPIKDALIDDEPIEDAPIGDEPIENEPIENEPIEDEASSTEIALPKELVKQDTKEIKTKKISEALDKQMEKILHEAAEPVQGSEEEPEEKPETAHKPLTHLNETQKAIFSYFVPVEGMETQICQILDHAIEKLEKESTSSATGNIIIQGGRGCGKTVLASKLIKALKKEGKCPEGRVGKIDAAVLNKKDLSGLLKKVAGGYLVIEQAGEINRETAIKLSLLLENDRSGLLVLMEDTRTGIAQALGRDEGLARKFTETIRIPVFTSDELVEFGKTYAIDMGYEIDTMGVLALYNRISNIQRLDSATTLTEVKEIVDEAIGRAEKKTLKKAFSNIISKRYTENDLIMLREKDFEE